MRYGNSKNKYKREKVIALELYADSDLLEGIKGSLRKDRVLSFSQKDRKFGFRYESRIWVHVDNNKYISEDSEHDAYTAF